MIEDTKGARQWQTEKEQKDKQRYTKHNIENQRQNNTNLPTTEVNTITRYT